MWFSYDTNAFFSLNTAFLKQTSWQKAGAYDLTAFALVRTSRGDNRQSRTSFFSASPLLHERVAMSQTESVCIQQWSMSNEKLFPTCPDVTMGNTHEAPPAVSVIFCFPFASSGPRSPLSNLSISFGFPLDLDWSRSSLFPHFCCNIATTPLRD